MHRTWLTPNAGCVLAAALLLGGCATKRDLRDLRTEVLALQVRQDSLLEVLQRDNRELLDSLRAGRELMLQVRGEIGRQLLSMEQQLVQIQELEGQSFSRLQELRRQIESRNQELQAVPATGGDAGAAPPTGGDAEQLYAAGMEQLQRGAAGTARRAFEQLVREHPQHGRAADAQFGIGESWALEQNPERAVQELVKVAERYPAAARAPQALFRAGVIEQERGNIPEARRYFEQVLRAYPSSDAAGQARERLRALPS